MNANIVIKMRKEQKLSQMKANDADLFRTGLAIGLKERLGKFFRNEWGNGKPDVPEKTLRLIDALSWAKERKRSLDFVGALGKKLQTKAKLEPHVQMLVDKAISEEIHSQISNSYVCEQLIEASAIQRISK